MRSCSSTSSMPEKESAVEILGCEMEFWPVMMVPLARETEMWCVKFVLSAGRTEV